MAGNAGIYYELPPYTALELKGNEGNWGNRELKYQRVASGSVWDLPQQWSSGAKISVIGWLAVHPFNEDKSSLVEAWNASGRPYYDYDLYNTERLSGFAQLDLRIDKNYFFRNWRLGWYVSLQNVTGSKLREQDAFLSTGIIENPSAPIAEQRYKLRTVKQETGSIIPSIGVTVEF